MIRMKQDYWINLPATHHSYGGTLAFADGHVEYHKWHEKTTAGNPNVKTWLQASWPLHGTQAKKDDRDLNWLREQSRRACPGLGPCASTARSRGGGRLDICYHYFS